MLTEPQIQPTSKVYGSPFLHFIVPSKSRSCMMTSIIVHVIMIALSELGRLLEAVQDELIHVAQSPETPAQSKWQERLELVPSIIKFNQYTQPVTSTTELLVLYNSKKLK